MCIYWNKLHTNSIRNCDLLKKGTKKTCMLQTLRHINSDNWKSHWYFKLRNAHELPQCRKWLKLSIHKKSLNIFNKLTIHIRFKLEKIYTLWTSIRFIAYDKSRASWNGYIRYFTLKIKQFNRVTIFILQRAD